MSDTESVARSKDLLRLAPLRALLTSRLYPGAFQIAAVAGLGLILYFALFGTIRPAKNFATLVTWTLWWAALPWSFLLVGRLWCAVCPIGAIGEWMQAVAIRLGLGPSRRPGALLKRYGPWLMVFSFVALAWVDRVFGVIGSPRSTGGLLLVLLGGAVLMGLLYQRRVWCRYLCPLGALSGVYSMTAAVELRADRARCAKCQSKLCYVGATPNPGCPLYEFPQTMSSNRNCTLCSACVKTCDHQAIAISVRPPGRDLWKLSRPVLAESILGVLMVALVYLQTIDMTLPWGDYVKAVIENTAIKGYTGAFTATFGGIITLAVAGYLAASWATSRISGIDFAASLAVFGYAYVPLALGGHLGHNFSHLLLEGPTAAQTALSQLGLLPIPQSPATVQAPPDFTVITILALTVLFLGIAGSFYTLLRLARRDGRSARTAWPQLTLLTLFSVAYTIMFLLPMNPRHGH